MKIFRNYINGKWQTSLSGKTVPVINPANGKIIGEAASSDSRDVEKAIHAARSSFYGSGKWRRLCAQDRADALLKIASMMEAERDELAAIETENHGKPLRESEADIDDAIHVFKYYAGLIMKPSGGSYEVNDNFGHMHSYTVHEPVGVCALITPWNYPLMIAVWKLAPALAAGNSIILKPATITPASVVKLFEILDRAGLPDGCANLILGPGGLIGNQLAKSKDVDCITFTGSTAVGQSIMCAASSNVKKIGLELGGKSPSIIFADADIDRAVEWSMIGIFMNQGEICSAGSRIIVHESIHDEFTDRLVERARKMTIVKEEIFGPVAAIQTFKTEDEAIALANDTEYGLAGAVFTNDHMRAMRVIKELRAGITWINCYNPCFAEGPWGGYKMSGIGRDLGPQGLEEYQEVKQINDCLDSGMPGWYPER